MKPLTLVAVAVVVLTSSWAASKDDLPLRLSSFDPDELRFSDAEALNPRQEELAKTLAKGDPADQLTAARRLWSGHSRKYATDVLKYVAGPPPGGDAFRVLQREVEASLQPRAILREVREGDYLWGTWLAFLRPHEDLVPTLLAGLKNRTDGGELAATALALGNSGDPRAVEPLLLLLKSKNYRTAGDAARALGYMGRPEVEPNLIEALAEGNGWRQVQACGALARTGTRRALPALERLAKDDRYTGALNVKGMAEYAIECIGKREREKR